ncbi:hypothetical protein L1049_020620 [Liquidambar formosana]|uniref:Uncharacterized protein n=1 Tax=Liquidambar formosana TaxID=63359 RepID=A0AAP0XA04_LIQFO
MSLLPKTQYDFQPSPSPSPSRLFFSSPLQRTSPSLNSPATKAAAILDSLDGLVRGSSASDPFAEEVPEMQREKTEKTRRQSTSMDGGRSFIIAFCCMGLYVVAPKINWDKEVIHGARQCVQICMKGGDSPSHIF